MSIPRWAVAALATLWWATEPLAAATYYEEELRRGAYPPNADSIMIPISQNTMGWLLFTPAMVLVAALAFWRAPRRVRLLAFDRARPIWCGVWSVAFGLLSIDGARWLARSLIEHHWWDAGHSALGVVAALALRAALCEVRQAQGSASAPSAA